jgi:amidohydrolase
MPLSAHHAKLIDQNVDAESTALADLAHNIHAHPELCFKETQAAGWICDLVEQRAHKVERGAYGMPTAFVARAGKPGGAKVAILAEYDALPEIGHACGHNLIATSAVGAFLAAAKVAGEAGGEVVLLGSPAEEGGGGKILLIERGAFEGVCAAMMFHPFDRDLLAHAALAMLTARFEFYGTPSHAAASPHTGTSALTACMDTFRLIDGQRVHFKDGVRVHGFITNGGQAVNIIPERAACEFSVRARDVRELARVQAVVTRCAEGAALASGVRVETKIEVGYKDMVNNMTMAKRFGEHLAALGRTAAVTDPTVGAGSTDMGDVSHVVPSIHPYLGIVDPGTGMCHEHRFAAAASSDRGTKTALDAAKTLAKTAVELLGDGPLRDAVRAEWQRATDGFGR